MISSVPDIKTLSLDPKLDSYVFLACDGIWNSLSSQEVVNFIIERFEEAKDDSPETLKSICIQVIKYEVIIIVVIFLERDWVVSL